MKFSRSAGILLHPTSLPGKFGIGDLGKEAFRFIDFMERAGQTLWQVFPLGPTGYGDSPYQCFSAFAGNPLLISPELLMDEGLLTNEDFSNQPNFDTKKIDFGTIIDFKYKILRIAFKNFKSSGKEIEKECKHFCKENSYWLEDFALFMAAKNYHGGVLWTEWDAEIAFRKESKIEKWKKKLQDEIEFQKFVQFKFDEQWRNVRNYANSKNIKIIGDLPIFIAYDSSDLWANRHLFSVNEKGKLEKVAGVPPDYFSPTGQLWGNPLYRWDVMKKDKFSWWRKRLTKMYELVDIVRIDHFRGFEAYWEIPGDAKTAQNGEWIKAPGHELFATIKEKLGDVPILAEDLGVITKEVEKLRDAFKFPGMKILQFAFGEDMEEKFLPHNHIPNCVVYSGSHDNDTTRGFFEKEKQNGSGIFEWAQNYMNFYDDNMCYAVIKTAYASVANIVVIPLQDMLNLGSEARMNFPGKLGGNWTWRFTWDQLTDDLADNYKQLTRMYERPPFKKR
ncbi:MAG: 4-alpha-glucanotransferase [Bacteroidetes bacterium]|nr:4-alpha-glucanotransferase [Bacteroidota bacterium]MBU1680044.1 4-alpha-glucanotransferase [Bacteroidota bacterium]MBU2505629.1 4-alpha-glucanotransferase [Bacteroidota bacterium]